MKAKIKKNIIVKYKWLCGFACLVIGLIACHPRTERPTLERAEAWMDSHPDSAQQLLEAIPQPERLSKEEYATWCLLVTQAHDKNYVVHTSDSIIDVAVRYFGERGEPQLYSKALYYKGRIWQDLGETEQATALFVRALDVGEQATDYSQLFLIASRLGTLYAHLNLQNEAMEAYQKALYYAVSCQDSSSISYAYSYIGRVYGLSEKWEQSFDYYEKALKLAVKISDKSAEKLAIQEYVAVCVNAEYFDKAEDLIDGLIEIGQREEKASDQGELFLTLGNLFWQIGENDKAAFYLKKALQSDNLHTLAGGSQCLYYLYEEQKLYKEAIRYNNLYWEYTDSIQRVANRKDIMEMSARYNHEKVENENLQLRLKMIRLIFYCVVGLLGASSVIILLLKRLKIKKRQVLEQNVNLEILRKDLEENSRQVACYLQEKKTLSVRLGKLQQECKFLKNQKLGLLSSEKKLQAEIDCLLKQNQKKENEIKKMKKEKPLQLTEYKDLQTINRTLERKIEALEEGILTVVDVQDQEKNVITFELLRKMRTVNKPLSEEEWNKLFVMVNLLYGKFVERLYKTFSNIKEEDLKLCCLVKLGFTNEEIASILCVHPDTVNKRKLRFKSKFEMGNWGKGGFDTFIAGF